MVDEAVQRFEDGAPLRVFWQPGCSSCVKVKEFLTSIGVDYTPVNILEDDRAMDELLALGIRSIPVLVQGERSVFAQSLDDVAAFVGRTRAAKSLSPDVLVERWLMFLHSGRDLAARLPDDRFEQRAISERPRLNRELAYHIFQIPEGFLKTLQDGMIDTRDVTNAKYDHLRSKADVLAYADGIIDRFERWQQGRQPGWHDAAIETYYGRQPLMQVLERGTWHSGQHVRQLDVVVSTLTGSDPAVPPAYYAGLPMPKGIWE